MMRRRPRPRVRLTLVQDLGPAPTTTAQCPRGPCPFTQCRHHLADSPSRCSLRDAWHGPWTLDQVGKHLGGLCRERIRQIETRAIARARGLAWLHKITAEDLPDPPRPSPWETVGEQWEHGDLTQPERLGAMRRNTAENKARRKRMADSWVGRP